ncbi:MAG TPA: hypothetical protein VMA36_10655 [Candidatus Limnocylindria bacterium]|nr:hypothetical protein [Candidatus Limnocylindria bacterium]
MLAACGGGGTTSTPARPAVIPPVASAAVTPAPVASAAAQGNVPVSETVAGSAAFVNPASHKTLYFLDSDTPTGGTCTSSACLGLWPPMAPTPGSQAGGGFTIITRSDGKGQQWAYQSHPLYMFNGDNGPDQANGDNFPEPPSGHWHVARPAAAAAPAPVAPTPAPATPAPCTGPYC